MSGLIVYGKYPNRHDVCNYFGVNLILLVDMGKNICNNALVGNDTDIDADNDTEADGNSICRLKNVP